MKLISLRSLIYGLICCLAVLFVGAILNSFHPIDSIITVSASLFGAIAPALIEKLSDQKISTHDQIILEEIKLLKEEIRRLSELHNDNENAIIAVQSVLACTNTSNIFEELNQLKNEIKSFKKCQNFKIEFEEIDD